MDAVDQVQLNFDPATPTVLNILIGLIMFGVALDVRIDDFKRVIRDPRGPLIGLAAAKKPELAARIRRPMKVVSLTAFGLFIVGALLGNWQQFLQNIGYVAFAVALHNALGCRRYDARAISIEVGIQNSALALVLIFGFFEGEDLWVCQQIEQGLSSGANAHMTYGIEEAPIRWWHDELDRRIAELT